MFSPRTVEEIRKQIEEEARRQFKMGDVAVAVKDEKEAGVEGLRRGQKWFVLAVNKPKETMIVSLMGVKADLKKLVLRVTSSVVGDVFK